MDVSSNENSYAEYRIHFGWSLNKAYKILRRLRDKGVFHSQLMWVILPNGAHAARVEEDGSRRLFSWLELHLQPMAQWGKVPDQVQTRFDPRVNGQGERANRFPLTPATDRGADTEEVSDDNAN